MSIVIAKKFDKGVVLMADRRLTCGNNVKNKVKKINKSPISNTAWGTAGYLRDANIIGSLEEIINYKDILEKTKIDEKYVVKNIIPSLFNTFKGNGRIEIEKDISYFLSSFLFCTSDKIFSISHDGAVVDNEVFSTIGCGCQYVEGLLNNIKEISDLTTTEKQLKKAILIACENDPYISKIEEDIDTIVLYKEEVE